MNQESLSGDAYQIDFAKVHTLIVNFIAGNETAEAKIPNHAGLNDGRLDFKAMKNHYVGQGLLSF